MGKRTDLTGLRFGRLTVAGFYAAEGARFWSCNCDCGTACVIVPTGKLTSGAKRSCGCLHREATSQRSKTHGGYATPEYSVWCGMRARCNNPKSRYYANYGGRGIKVCERWDSFAHFLADMGNRPAGGYSIERNDVNRGYEPENCRWATRKEQQNNRRDNIVLSIDGITATLAQHCERTGVKQATARYRLKAGYSSADVIEVTHRQKRRQIALAK